jgi:hypothetical protein
VARLVPCGRSDPSLPGARKPGLLDRALDDQAGLAGLRLGTKTAGDRIEERAHELNVRVLGAELGLHPIDQFKHVFLIAPRKGERTDGFVNGAEGLMDPIQVCGFHRPNLTQQQSDSKRRGARGPHCNKRTGADPCNPLPCRNHKLP